MKKVLVFLLVVLLLTLVGCELQVNVDHSNSDTNEVILVDDDIKIRMGQEYQLNLTINGKPNYHFRYDESYFLLEKNRIKPIKIGQTTLSLIVDDKVAKTIEVTIYQDTSNVSFTTTEDVVYLNTYGYFKVNSDGFKYSVSDESKATINENSGFLVAKATGFVDIIATSIYSNSQIKKQIHIVKEATDYVVSSRYGEVEGNLVIIGDDAYEIGKQAFDTISAAVASGKPKYPIYVQGVINSETVDITKDGLIIDGSSISALAEINFNIKEGVSGVTIQNFPLTGNSHIILEGGNTNITLFNDKFIDTAPIDLAWQATNAYTSGLIVLKQGTEYHNNIKIDLCKFRNVSDCCINASNVLNFTVCRSTFESFDKDAVRMNHGIVKRNATWLYENNLFVDGTYSGLYFRTYGSDNAEVHHYVAIFNNTFTNCGKDSEQYSAAICFRNYQEGSTEVNIAYNEFSSCNKMIFLRNNAVAANQTRFTGYVTGNIFYSVPSKYYFNNLNSSDSASTNPVQTKLLNNIFLSGRTDITPNASLFIGAATNTTLPYSDYPSLLQVPYPHVFFVDKQIDVIDMDQTVISDSEMLSLTAGILIALKEGLTTVTFQKNGRSATHEFRCVKEVELVVKFILIALGEIGYQEMDANGNTGTSGNYTKYGAWYGINPGAWCAMYVSWCANQAGVSTSIIPKYASVSLGMEWFQDKGLFQYKENYTPKAGDILFMKSDGASHTGIVLYCDGVTVYTVEGNTSDQCAMRKYSVNYSKITGYGTPEWPSYSEDGYNFSNGTASGGEGNTTT